MNKNPLNTIMAPNSVSFLGASNNPMKMGTGQMRNMLFNKFPGKIFPVHPTEKELLGIKAYPSIKELPQTPDLAIFVVPSRLIPAMMIDFGEIGTRHAVIMSAGFKEIGEEGVNLENHLLEICKKYDIRFVGPNCMGVLNKYHPFNCTVSPYTDKPGKIGLIAQSGTYVAQTHIYLKKRGISFGKAIGVGNASSISLADCLEYLGEDDETKAIGLYIESINEGGRFLELAKQITRTKPIVAQYIGGTKTGARAGLSHTGAMAGPDYIYNGLFEQAGILRVDTIEEVYYLCHAFSTQPLPKGKRIGILTNSGGPGTAIGATLDGYDVEVPELSASLREKIDSIIPAHGSSRNPVDITVHPDRTILAEKLPEILIKSDEIDGLVIHGVSDTGWLKTIYPTLEQFAPDSLESLSRGFKTNVDKLVALPSKFGKPIVMSSFFQQEDHAARTCMANGVPFFDSPEKAAKTMAILHQYSRIKAREPGRMSPVPHIPPRAREIMDTEKALDEYSAKEVLRAYGIPTCREVLVHSQSEAKRAAEEIGFPVALKGCSPRIQHKTEAGIVHLGIQNEEGVDKAFEAIAHAAGDIPILVCEMVKGSREIMAGMTRLQGFPPAILFGLGGIFAEILKDNAVRLAPFDLAEALRQIESIRSADILGPYRGMVPVDKEKLADLLVSLGHISVHFPQIKEIDMNPIFIAEGKPVVIDALFVL